MTCGTAAVSVRADLPLERLSPVAMDVDCDGRDVAVLTSGGIESAVLCAALRRRGARVFPLYFRFGLRWEEVELAHLRAFLAQAAQGEPWPVHVLDEPIAEAYGDAHWSTRAGSVPDARTPDEAVYLPGRNLLLGAKAAVWCRLNGVERLAFGCLASNPFPDSTGEFFRGLEALANRALGGQLRIVRPFARWHKPDVIGLGAELGLPLWETFSCIHPVRGAHCGTCNKCGERRTAFRDAGVADHTPYAAAALSPRE